MCGIVGFVGKNIKTEDFIEGLKKLEYRGYDSAGIAYNKNNKLSVIKKTGRIASLEEECKEILKEKIESGIAHTRWATHGSVSEANSHPHCDCKGEISLVHNGIIENYQDLKKELIEKGHIFKSDTDSEVIVHLIEEEYRGDLFNTVLKVVKKFEGAYAIAVIHKDFPDLIIAARKGSPLVISKNDEKSILASDVTPILKYSKEVMFLNDGEIALLTEENYKIYDLQGKEIIREPYKIEWDEQLAEKEGFSHFMEKEIFEQKQSIKAAISGRIRGGQPVVTELEPIKDFIKEKLESIYILACGTSYNAGLALKYFINRYSDININIEVSSEFRYMNPHVDETTLIIAISQSGETLDTLEGLRIAKDKGAYVVAMSNVFGSTIARESNSAIYMNTGPEIGVAATKTYTAQIAILYSIGAQIIKWKNQFNLEISHLLSEIEKISDLYEQIFEKKEKIFELAKKYKDYLHMMYIGRNFGYTAALEGALKLKEISYIHATAYQAGELKHGPIALIDEHFPVFGIIPFDGLKEKMISNIMEVKARKAKVVCIVPEEIENLEEIVDDYITVPEVSEPLLPLIVAPITQLFSYYVAVLKELDPDKPRNLAKSVTVE
jgi:glucosamine--fructose-6-phosphate aminotransferase (isomerizing)